MIGLQIWYNSDAILCNSKKKKKWNTVRRNYRNLHNSRGLNHVKPRRTRFLQRRQIGHWMELRNQFSTSFYRNGWDIRDIPSMEIEKKKKEETVDIKCRLEREYPSIFVYWTHFEYTIRGNRRYGFESFHEREDRSNLQIFHRRFSLPTYTALIHY